MQGIKIDVGKDIYQGSVGEVERKISSVCGREGEEEVERGILIEYNS